MAVERDFNFVKIIADLSYIFQKIISNGGKKILSGNISLPVIFD